MYATEEFTIEQALEHVFKPSYELARVQFMGWTFGKPTIEWEAPYRTFRLRVSFTCVCGRQEEFHYRTARLEEFQHVDVARQLVRGGSFSRTHLLEDGYTEEQVREIERKGEEFDRITREHWECQILRAGGYDQFRMRQLARENAPH